MVAFISSTEKHEIVQFLTSEHVIMLWVCPDKMSDH